MKPKAKDVEEKKRRARIVMKELNRLFPEGRDTPLAYSSPFELLLAVILSAQTTDTQVNKVTPELFKICPSPERCAEVPQRDLEQTIRSLGFFRSKARNIKKTSEMLRDKFNDSVPTTFEELLELPGVGRKTAHVVRGHIAGEAEGIAVDTHVKRLARKFQLTDSTKPEQIERDLMEIFPRSQWWDLSSLLKAYGREISPARSGTDDPISKKLARGA